MAFSSVHPNHIIPFSFSEESMMLMATPIPRYPNLLFFLFPFYHFQFWSNFSVPTLSMDPINASPSSNEPQIHGALDLLEFCWFFDNLLLRRNPTIKVSHSDPCLSDVAHQVFVESPVCYVSPSALDGGGLLEDGGGKRWNLLRTPSLPSRMDRGEGIREEGSGSTPLLEDGVVVEICDGNVGSPALDMDVPIGNGGGEYRKLLRTPSLPSQTNHEEGFRENGNGSRTLLDNGVVLESHGDDACSSALDMNVLLGNGGSKRRSLLRMPSLPSRVVRDEGIRDKGNGSRALLEQCLLKISARPPCVERKEEGTRSKESGSTRRSKSARKPRHGNLLRTPSLPPCIGREKEFGEKEAAARIRNSIQPNLSEFFPTRQEILEKKFSLPMCRISTSNDEMWHKLLIQMRRRSQSELESEELQGFKDLGFTFDKKDINPTVVDIIPGLREKKEEKLENERTKGPYLSEAWMLQTHLLPSIPKWDSRKSAEDMKQQIKFWARSVASNVH